LNPGQNEFFARTRRISLAQWTRSQKYNICPCWYSNRNLNKEHKATETGKRLAEEDNKKMLVR